MITELKLKNFGIHKEKVVQLQPGITAIIGQNRKGKSTLLEAISYAYFSKTNKSAIDRLIKENEKQAEVELFHGNQIIKRVRTVGASKLSKIKKFELDKLTNLTYAEFNRLFYISSTESFKLFDPAFFRDFLIDLFNLKTYSDIYNKLHAEQKSLTVELPNNVVDKQGCMVKQKKLLAIQTTCNTKLTQLNLQIATVQQLLDQLNKQGIIIQQNFQKLKHKKQLLDQRKCYTCQRPFTQEGINKGMAVIQRVHVELTERQAKQVALITPREQEKQNLLNQKFDIEQKLYQIQNALGNIQGQLAVSQVVIKESPRLAEVKSLLPIFNPKGFPLYLLQVYVPCIEATANSLLQTIFPEMAIKIQTVKPDTSIPDLRVLINGKQLIDFSGSERSLINLCLRLGVLIIFKELRKTEIDFFLIDEGIEAFDDENSLKVLNLLQRFIAKRYLSQIIIVTHKKILKNQPNINYIEL